MILYAWLCVFNLAIGIVVVSNGGWVGLISIAVSGVLAFLMDYRYFNKGRR